MTSSTIPATAGATLIVSGSGRIVNYSVVVAGSGAGTIYNAPSSTAVLASNALATIPASATVGVTPVGLHFTSGIVLTPGTGQSINVTYSMDP